MKVRIYKRRDKGVALLAVMFAMLLLSVIGLGMMYSTNMETAINNNYKDKQVAMYSAIAGLYEARDRIQPLNGDLASVLPNDLPALDEPNVIYILADDSVVPWDPDNEYFDNDLCHAQVLGLSGTHGVPCTTMVDESEEDWRYVVYNDDESSDWFSDTPLDVKWTRIMLKTNNNTPFPVDGNPNVSDQVCYDQINQMTLPGGYGSTCGPDGSIADAELTNPGSGYTAEPTVTVEASPAMGGDAVIEAVTETSDTDEIAEITVTNPGADYTADFPATITGDGTGAAATVHVIPPGSSPVDEVHLTNSGTANQCYATDLADGSITISGGAGTGASARGFRTAGADTCIAQLTVEGKCGSGLGNGETVTITLSGNGSTANFVGTVVMKSTGGGRDINSPPQQAVIKHPGVGFTSFDWSTMTKVMTDDDNESCLTSGNTIAVGITPGRTLGSIELTDGGINYSEPISVTVPQGSGDPTYTGVVQAAAAGTLGTPDPNAGQIDWIEVTSGGTGYTADATTVTLELGDGTGGAAEEVMGAIFTIADLNVTTAGYGYTVAPDVTIAAPGTGVTATGKATIGHGPNYGKVYVITSLAVTATGARAMAQMEVAGPLSGFAMTGALTVAGPNDPSNDGDDDQFVHDLPSSGGFLVSGQDADSCGEGAYEDRPAIGAYDDPDDPNASAVDTIVDEINETAEAGQYVGSGGDPSVENVYSSLGETMGTPAGLQSLLEAIRGTADNCYGCGAGDDPVDRSSVPLGTEASPVINYVHGDLTISGNDSGYGILVVTGEAVFGGNFSWHGLILVVGEGVADLGGGGTGQLVGSVIVAKIWEDDDDMVLLDSLGEPDISWNGGGGNRIQYDHCWADNMATQVPFTPPPSSAPLSVLSFRILPY